MAILATALRGFISLILTLATLILPGVVGDVTAPQAPLDSKNCLLNFATVSDIHMQTKEYHELNSFLVDLTVPLLFPDIEKLLKKYDNVFLISGHIHAGFSNADTESKYGYQSIESDGSFHSINLPRTNAIQIIGNPMVGYGYVVEVYEDRVEFRARNYMLGTWDPKYNYTIELV